MSSETKPSSTAESSSCGGVCKTEKAESKEGRKAGQNGKGSAPRSMSTTFRNNYDSINWGKKG